MGVLCIKNFDEWKSGFFVCLEEVDILVFE